MNTNELMFFGGFILFVVTALALDLGVFNKKDHEISAREAGVWSLVWIGVALGLYWIILHHGEKVHGITSMEELGHKVALYKQAVHIDPSDFQKSLDNYRHTLGMEFITGYVLELSLSVDNIFVILLVFSAFGVRKDYYHRVLFWGILGAVIFRFIFIFAGALLVTKFEWILYLFAAILVFSGLKMLLKKEKGDSIDVEHHPVVRLASKFFAIHPQFEGSNFFHRIENKLHATPLFLVLLIIEFTDLIFAVDSIPAVFSVTKDPYIVFFSNIFAILGLRSMFFLLLNVIHRFHFFKTGLSLLLIFIGLKMVFHEVLEGWGFETLHSLLVILSILILSMAASLIFPKKHAA